jgi:hypothetical protein
MGYLINQNSTNFIKIDRILSQSEIYTIATIPILVYTAVANKALVLISAAIVNDKITVNYNNPNEIALRSSITGFFWGTEPANLNIFRINTTVYLAPFDAANATIGGYNLFTNNISLTTQGINPTTGAGSSRFIAYGYLVDY